jgi:tRNA threonylcarbamoyladenosine biosynthesis protein TsaB
VNILAIDCATEILSVALGCNFEPQAEAGGSAAVGSEPAAGRKNPSRAVFSTDIDAGNSHSELLFPVLDSLLKTANIETAALDLFLCSRGPGSWTGLRIGFSAVKGFALALGKPYVSIPTLDYMALSAPESGFLGLILPVLDAKAGRFFCALYEGAGRAEGPRRISDYLDAAPETIAALVPAGRELWLTGNGAQMFLETGAIQQNKIMLDANSRRGRAQDLLKYLEKNATIVYGDKSLSDVPLYLRKSDAEINLERIGKN